jgi:uncharacterized membrane protein YdbT with pleckstrin-like domain
MDKDSGCRTAVSTGELKIRLGLDILDAIRMAYLDKLLIPGESVVHYARRSVAATFGGLFVFLALVLVGTGVAYALSAPAAGLLGTTMLIAVALVLAVLLLGRYIWWRNKVYVVTNLRVMKLEGIFSKSHRDASLDKINDLVMTQSLLGRMLGYGDLQVLTANEASGMTYHQLHDPVEFKRQVLQVRTTEMADGPGLGAASAGDPIAQLERLGQLRTQGVITEAEFLEKKKRLMERIG